MKLYTFFRGSSPFRLRIALNLKGLPYEAIAVHLGKGEHRKSDFGAINPQQLLPALVLDDGHVLNQSLAIIEYLDETHPNPPLIPKEPKARARVRSLSLLVACEIHPLNNARTLAYLRKQMGQSEEQVSAWYRHWIADGLAKLEAEMTRGPGTGKFSHGDAPTMADCCLVPQIFNAQRFNCELAPYPTLMRVYAECMKLEAFDRAQPSKQPDAE
ncbi:MAG: maleylacetoacetate isomerase [Betaproteobacteria bacterium]|nr:MAG: maleylacetoacetate isomerase [Betaproteobacteria bacterium]